MIDLDEAERQLLLVTLRDRLGTLREQVHHATISTFSDQLKDEQAVARSLIEKLESPNCVTTV